MTIKDVLWALDPRTWINNGRWMLVDWLEGGRFQQMALLYETAESRLRDLENRISNRDAGVVPNRPYGRLPDARFVGVHDYGKNVTREEALTYSRIDVPGAGVSVKVDKEGTVTITRDEKPIVVLPKKGGVN